MSSCLQRARAARLSLLVVVGVAAVAVLGPGARAQQHADRNGIVFSAEAGPLGKPSLFTLMSAKGELRRFALRILDGARVPSVRREAGLRVGTLTVGDAGMVVALVVPRGAASSSASSDRITLARRGALRVVFAPGARTFIRVTGLPGGTRSVQLTFRGGKGQVVTSAGCRGGQDFRVTVVRAGSAKPVAAEAGTTC